MRFSFYVLAIFGALGTGWLGSKTVARDVAAAQDHGNASRGAWTATWPPPVHPRCLDEQSNNPKPCLVHKVHRIQLYADVSMRWAIKIPLRDGINLNATLYLPRRDSGPAPSIFTLTPYVGQMWHEFGVYFAANGYPFLTVDVRGRGNS